MINFNLPNAIIEFSNMIKPRSMELFSPELFETLTTPEAWYDYFTNNLGDTAGKLKKEHIRINPDKTLVITCNPWIANAPDLSNVSMLFTLDKVPTLFEVSVVVPVNRDMCVFRIFLIDSNNRSYTLYEYRDAHISGLGSTVTEWVNGVQKISSISNTTKQYSFVPNVLENVRNKPCKIGLVLPSEVRFPTNYSKYDLSLQYLNFRLD